jgi:hypothetical protein
MPSIPKPKPKGPWTPEEHLLAMKRAAGRSQDLEDLKRLEPA